MRRPEAVKSAVLGGLGIGILFRSRVDPEIRRGEVAELEVPALNEIKTRSFIIYAKHRPLSSAAKEFLHTLRRIRSRAGTGAALHATAKPAASLISRRIRARRIDVAR